MNETTQNFLDVFANLPPWEPPVVLFRLYYNDSGQVIEYSHEDKPGNYIDVDPETFRDQPRNIRVVNGNIIKIDPPSNIKKLVHSDAGTACDPRDVCIVVDSTQKHVYWSLKTNETN